VALDLVGYIFGRDDENNAVGGYSLVWLTVNLLANFGVIFTDERHVHPWRISANFSANLPNFLHDLIVPDGYDSL
jgi:hypothetical protein